MCYKCGNIRPSEGPRELKIDVRGHEFAYKVGPGTVAVAVDSGWWEMRDNREGFPSFEDKDYFEIIGPKVSEKFQKMRIKQNRLKLYRRANRSKYGFKLWMDLAARKSVVMLKADPSPQPLRLPELSKIHTIDQWTGTKEDMEELQQVIAPYISTIVVPNKDDIKRVYELIKKWEKEKKKGV